MPSVRKLLPLVTNKLVRLWQPRGKLSSHSLIELCRRRDARYGSTEPRLPPYTKAVANDRLMMASYPSENAARERWIVARRSQRHAVDPSQPYAFLVEEERAESGEIVGIATIFLTNRECPWKCLMCDLWKNTLTESVAPGAIPAQIDYALAAMAQSRAGILPAQKRTVEESLQSRSARLDGHLCLGRLESCPTLRQIKLYNSGSFFDPKAVPIEDYQAIAERVRSFERVIVECHPALVGERCLRFRDLLASGSGKLEVAMGLETANPAVLEKLNKRMTLELFSRAADFLRASKIALRVFILVKPPFQDEAEGLYWAERSLDFAFQCGASVASLIPTRPGNGALEALAEQGQFSPPKLSTLERALAYGVGLKKGRVFADLWDLERFSDCPACFPARAERLRQMNLRQEILPEAGCAPCNAVRQPQTT